MGNRHPNWLDIEPCRKQYLALKHTSLELTLHITCFKQHTRAKADSLPRRIRSHMKSGKFLVEQHVVHLLSSATQAPSESVFSRITRKKKTERLPSMRKRDFVTNTSALEEGGGLTSGQELAVMASTKGGAGMQMTIDALLTVLRKQGDWVEAQALAEAFQVTTRTVRSYVRRANKSRQIIESSHRGYRLMANAGEYAMPSARITPVAKRDNRLLMMLLSRPGAQSVYDLAEVLHVSDSSLSALFRSLRPRLSERGLHLARRREFVWIEGAERDKRRLIRHIMREHPLADFPSPVANLPAGNTLDPTETNRLVKDVLDKNELACSDFGLDNLVIHLQIMASRISLGSAISDTDLELDRSIRRLSACRQRNLLFGRESTWHRDKHCGTHLRLPHRRNQHTQRAKQT